VAQQYGQPREGNRDKKKQQQENFPLLAYTCSLNPDDETFKSDSKVERLVSKKLRQKRKPEVPYLAFTSVPGNPPLKCPLPPETDITVSEHYSNVSGHPETEGNSFRMQWQCCFVDIMLECTRGDVRTTT